MKSMSYNDLPLFIKLFFYFIVGICFPCVATFIVLCLYSFWNDLATIFLCPSENIFQYAHCALLRSRATRNMDLPFHRTLMFWNSSVSGFNSVLHLFVINPSIFIIVILLVLIVITTSILYCIEMYERMKE